MKNYLIISAYTTRSLEEQVDTLMIEGWVPCGGVAVWVDDRVVLTLYQAMIFKGD